MMQSFQYKDNDSVSPTLIGECKMSNTCDNYTL